MWSDSRLTESPSVSLGVSFVAGAATASLFWLLVRQETDAHVRNMWEVSIHELKTKIEELKKAQRRSRWPWDRRRRPSPRNSEHNFETMLSSTQVPTQKVKDNKALCIGGIFGLDVGGSLAKLAYFEDYSSKEQSSSHQDDFLELRHRQQQKQHQQHPVGRRQRRSQSYSDQEWQKIQQQQDQTPSDPSTLRESSDRPEVPTSIDSGGVKRSRSMLDMKTKQRDHAEALDRFYAFAKRLDDYRGGLRDHKLSFFSHELGGEFHFLKFETRRMQPAMDLIRAHQLHLNIQEMGGTGGGAHKFANVWKEQLGIRMIKQDELDSLVAGMQFVLSTVVGECYTFRPNENSTLSASGSRASSMDSDDMFTGDGEISESGDDGPKLIRGLGDEWWWSRKVQRDSISYSSTYPYLVVTIGTGVSVLRVDGPRQYERVSGSTIGGGTYWGLIRLLTDVEEFDDVMRLAERGDPSKVDMYVGDIYGENSDALEKLKLPSNLVASSFGKLVAKEDPAAGLRQEDLARALLLMITNNIGQVAYLNAKLMKTRRIYFVGNFLRHNKFSQRRLSYAINFWSKGEMEALFLEHEGYFGALGAFLLAQNVSVDGKTGEEEPRRSESVSRRNTTIGLDRSHIADA